MSENDRIDCVPDAVEGKRGGDDDDVLALGTVKSSECWLAGRRLR